MGKIYLDEGGDLRYLTASSDASIPRPGGLVDQLREIVLSNVLPLERALPLVTSNTARTLKLHKKGALRQGHDADLVVMTRAELRVRDVLARGRRFVRDGTLCVSERFLSESDRVVTLRGQRAGGSPNQG